MESGEGWVNREGSKAYGMVSYRGQKELRELEDGLRGSPLNKNVKQFSM
jgi:hypothetical protein